MSKSVKFVFGLHNHQPTGNFDHVFQDAHDRAYAPFLDLLENHPTRRVTLHYTGILLEWLREHHPDFLRRLRRLGERGQVEFMTGGFFEPILPIVPDHDKLGQILKLTDFVRRHMRQSPRGMWLAERVWEPHLPLHMHEAGVEYTVVDDMHFKCTGIAEEDCVGHFLTEELGRPVSVFPISERLRYTIPFRPVQETIDHLRSMATEDGMNVVVMADDGEKFGVWPGTHEHCYGEGWFDQFFTALEENSDWIEMVTFAEVLDSVPPRGRVYLPTASYIEMMEWALTPRGTRAYEEFVELLRERDLYEANKIFVRGGFWRFFQAKYDESNLIHKRMLHISDRVHRTRQRHPRSREIARAQDCLWRAQCNCAYWHGVFGGLYLTNLRSALWRNLIEADAIIERARHKNPAWIEAEELDLDVDGHPEVLLKTPVQNLLFKPSLGGMLIAHEFKPAQLNLTDTLMRREEAYHIKLAHAVSPGATPSDEGSTASIHDLVIAKEPDLERHLCIDWYRRGSLIDHFLSDGAALGDFHRARHGEDGDFVNQPYTAEFRARAGKGHVTLSRDGALYRPDGVLPLRVTKTVRAESLTSTLNVDYILENIGGSEIRTRFGVEFNVNLLAGDAPDRFVWVQDQKLEDRRLVSMGENLSVSQCGLVDEWMGVNVRWDFEDPATLWRCPIETVSLSEAGFERVYQSTVIFPHWDDVVIAPGETWGTHFTVTVEKFK
ncbi:DUF1926 domain-containing protein [Candidatus Sumerlaeota bacterium]|nr:DUF1926 domain-containing protein [Candidatus Sumerlaeota bacterium]